MAHIKKIFLKNAMLDHISGPFKNTSAMTILSTTICLALITTSCLARGNQDKLDHHFPQAAYKCRNNETITSLIQDE